MDMKNRPESSSGMPLTGDGLSRRRLMRGGLGAVPVVMTLSSPSVMATTGGSCTPGSSFASMNASGLDKRKTCSGRTPGYWKQSQWHDRWPSPYCATGAKATKFDDVFGSRHGYPNQTLLQVLGLGGGGRDALARHLVAALLNAASGLTPREVLSEVTVKSIWQSITDKGFYEPTAGVRWYLNSATSMNLFAAGSVEVDPTGGLMPWLESTMPV